MFIAIRFGEDRQLLFNANCRSRVLYEDIKNRCECQQEDMIDLADENGLLKNLPERPDQQYATEYLPGRASYILLRVKKTEDFSGKECREYEPMLNGLQETNPDFMAKVYSKKVNPDVVCPSSQRAVASPKPATKTSRATSRSQTKAATPSNVRINVSGSKGKNARHH